MNSMFERFTFRTIRILASAGTIAVFGAHTLPHIIPKKTIESQHRLPHCTPGERYEQLLREVCLQMNIDYKKIRLFYNNEFSTVSAGCLRFPGQSFIGLPRNCSFSTVEDIRKSPIAYEGKGINWDSAIGKALEDVLLISDEHVKFLMAHELVHIKNVHFVAKTLHATGIFVGTYVAGNHISRLGMNRSFGPKGTSLHLVLYQILTWTLGFLLYLNTRQGLSHWIEYKADEHAAQLGLEYSNGGMDCMRSRLKLNRVLRKMHGLAGEEMFSEEGDNLVSTSSHPKRTDRLKRIKEIKKSLESPLLE